jgi:serine/threonine protein kinase
MREVDIHKRIIHENIVRLYTYFERDNTVYLLLEYAEKGNLFYIIRNKKQMSEAEAFYYFI